MSGLASVLTSVVLGGMQQTRADLVRCPARRHMPGWGTPTPEAEIPTFYSYLHLRHSGWVFTKDPNFCPPNLADKGAWICPECASKYEWKTEVEA